MTTPLAMTSSLNILAERLVHELVTELDGVYCAQVATIDGFEVAQAQRQEVSASRLAAMASSLAALGAEMSREVRIGESRGVILEADQGYAVTQIVPRDDGGLVVSLLADRRAMLGMVMLRAAACGKSLAAA